MTTVGGVRLAPRIRSLPKLDGHGVHRTISPSETWRRMQPTLRRIGVTRVADITGLDHLGIPVYSCVRPAAAPAGVSVTCGKGTSRAQARAGAVMEALEYHCAESLHGDTRRATFEELVREANALDPAELIMPVWSPYRPDRRLEWVCGWSLADGEPWWIPANAVLHPYLGSVEQLMILRGSTNGLASGNELEEAVCHALAELIERDAWSLCWVRVRHGQGECFPGVDFARENGTIGWMLDRFAQKAVEVRVRDITSELGVPTYYAATLERISGGALAHEGMGAHPDPSVALVRALAEAAQSRAADIHGAREDLDYWRNRAGVWNESAPGWGLAPATVTVPFDAARGARHADIRDDIAWMVARLADAGLDRVFVVELTRPELGAAVVRVVVPGLEFVAIDQYRAGPRAQSAVGRPEVRL
jgi:ribosomal protein S12 methylthiotransferase accessory factor